MKSEIVLPTNDLSEYTNHLGNYCQFDDKFLGWQVNTKILHELILLLP